MRRDFEVKESKNVHLKTQGKIDWERQNFSSRTSLRHKDIEICKKDSKIYFCVGFGGKSQIVD